MLCWSVIRPFSHGAGAQNVGRPLHHAPPLLSFQVVIFGGSSSEWTEALAEVGHSFFPSLLGDKSGQPSPAMTLTVGLSHQTGKFMRARSSSRTATRRRRRQRHRTGDRFSFLCDGTRGTTKADRPQGTSYPVFVPFI